MKKDILITLGVQVFIMISILLTYKLAMVFYAKSGFAEYSLIKRNVALINPLLMLGLGAALTRYTALSVDDDKKIYDYFLSSFLFMIIAFIFLWGIILIFPEGISKTLYGSVDYIKFLMPMFSVLVGLSLHVLVYSYFRGKLDMAKANILQIMNLGIIPLLGFYFASVAENVFYYSGIMTILFLVPIIIYILYKRKLIFLDMFRNSKKLIYYGIQRVPGDFGIMALFSLPVLVSTHLFGVETGGYIAFSIALLNMAGQVVEPLGVVFLPKISQLIVKKEFLTIEIYIKKLFILSLILSWVILILFYFMAEDFLILYLGHVDNALLGIIKSMIFGIVGYMLYVSLRSVVDAYYDRGINTINILIGLVVSVLLYILLYLTDKLKDVDFVIYTFLIGVFVVASLTILTVRKSMKIKV